MQEVITMTSHCLSRLILWNKLPRVPGYYLLTPTYSDIVKIKAEIVFAAFQRRTNTFVQVLRCSPWWAGEGWQAGLNIPSCVLNAGWTDEFFHAASSVKAASGITAHISPWSSSKSPVKSPSFPLLPGSFASFRGSGGGTAQSPKVFHLILLSYAFPTNHGPKPRPYYDKKN